MQHLVFKREPDRNVPTCVVPIDARRPCTPVETGMYEADAGERHQVDSVLETHVILADPSHSYLKEVPGWREEHHRPEREVPVNVVIQVESECKHGAVDRPAGKPQIRAESPLVFR